MASGITRIPVNTSSSKILRVPCLWQYTIAAILCLNFRIVAIKLSTVSALLLLSRCFVIVLLMTSCHKTILALDLRFPLLKKKSKIENWGDTIGIEAQSFRKEGYSGKFFSLISRG